ncbi:MAG TPA: hypothetical protein ENK21_00060 [Trueperaceae bacterium]|nr:hypothetical protein [Trueperaceae bacterium]
MDTNALNLELLGPYIQQISFGFVAGFVVGYALKKVGKMVAIALGLIFIILQILAYYGFITINWGAVEDTVNPVLEQESLTSIWKTVINILTYNISFAAAFIPAFILGIKKG